MSDEKPWQPGEKVIHRGPPGSFYVKSIAVVKRVTTSGRAVIDGKQFDAIRQGRATMRGYHKGRNHAPTIERASDLEIERVELYAERVRLSDAIQNLLRSYRPYDYTYAQLKAIHAALTRAGVEDGEA